MKPWSWDKQLGLASPLKCAAIQSGQTKNPSKNEVGLDASHHAHTSPEGRGKYFFLDILSHRMSVIGIYRQLTRSLPNTPTLALVFRRLDAIQIQSAGVLPVRRRPSQLRRDSRCDRDVLCH